MKKLAIILPTTLMITTMLSGCAIVDSIKEDLNLFQTEDYYNVDNDIDLDEIEEPVVEKPTSFQTKNFTISLNNPDYAIEPQRGAEMTMEYAWVHDDVETTIQCDYEAEEGTIEYALDEYNDLEVYNDFRGKTNNKKLIIYYRNNNKVYTKLTITPIKTTSLKDGENLDTEYIGFEILDSVGVLDAISTTTTKNEGVDIIVDTDYEVVISPDEFSEVKYTENEEQIIYKLIYEKAIAKSLLEQLNKVGVYNITSAKLLPSDSGYLIEITSGGKKYLGHLNSDFHVDYIQKDNLDGEYLYLEKIKE